MSFLSESKFLLNNKIWSDKRTVTCLVPSERNGLRSVIGSSRCLNSVKEPATNVASESCGLAFTDAKQFINYVMRTANRSNQVSLAWHEKCTKRCAYKELLREMKPSTILKRFTIPI